MADLFKFLNKMNEGDLSYVDSLSDDEAKALSPYVIMMWINGASKNVEYRVILTDLYVNQYIFSLNKHPRLLLKLFVAANEGLGSCRYTFQKTLNKNNKHIYRMIANHYKVSYDEAKDYHRLLSESDIEELKEIYGEIE